MRDGQIQLLWNNITEMVIFEAASIPAWPVNGRHIWPAQVMSGANPAQLDYVSWLYAHIDRVRFPSSEEFKAVASEAMNTNQKFSLLKDLRPDKFHDLIGEVIRVYDTTPDSITIYLSDYTSQELFYDNPVDGGEPADLTRDGDEYGYTVSRTRKPTDWPGPYGKMAMQLTIYPPHIQYIRDHVKTNSWVMIKNVHTRMSPRGQLEGRLHGDRRWPERIQVSLLEPSSENPEMTDTRLKDGIRRKRAYWRRLKEDIKELRDEGAMEIGGKRKNQSNHPGKSNGKKRRRQAQMEVEEKLAAVDKGKADQPGLNMHGMSSPLVITDILIAASQVLASG